MPKALNKPSAEQEAEFDEYIKHWQQVLNLRDWRIEKGQRPEKDAMASVTCDGPARLAVYRVGHFGATPVTPQSLSLTALHEVLHVFLFDLIAVAQDRGAPSEALEAAEHRVITVLEHVLGETYASAGSQ